MTRVASRLTLMCCVLGLFAACRDLDVVTEAYATLEEARRAGAIRAGRLPDGLPPGTRDIREAHDLDTGRRWALFSFPPEEGRLLAALLQPNELTADGLRCEIPERIEWWPVLLRGDLNSERIRSTGLQLHRARDAQLVFAVNWKQGRAYSWAE